jgi:hypothetical protein
MAPIDKFVIWLFFFSEMFDIEGTCALTSGAQHLGQSGMIASRATLFTTT